MRRRAHGPIVTTPRIIYVELCQPISSAGKETGEKYKDARDPAFNVAQVRGQQRVPAHCCIASKEEARFQMLLRSEKGSIEICLCRVIVCRVQETIEDDRFVGLE